MKGKQQEWSVDIHEDGRSGKVVYREAARSLSFFWEFGGGDTVAIVHVGDKAAWRQQHAWAIDRRAEILQRIASETIRQKAPSCRAEIDERQGWINIRQTTSPPRLPTQQQQFLRVSAAKSKIMLIASIVLVVGVLAFWGVTQALSIRVPHGAPSGNSVRAGGEIATLIQTLETYVPSLHRNPDNDRYHLSLFLYPVDGSSPGRLVPLAKNLRAQEAGWAKLLGGDGRTVWFSVNGIGGLDLATGKRIGPTELRAANPTLAESWDDPRRISFDNRLRLTLPDRRTVVEIDPQTLKATPAQPERTQTALPLAPGVQDFLSSGVRPSPEVWLGLHSPQEAERDYKPKSWLTRAGRQPDAKEMRRLYQGQLGPELAQGNREILSMTPLSNDAYLNAAFVRSGPGADTLRLSDPDGFLMVFTSAPGLAGTLVVARVNADGKLAWKVDTGIDRFKLSQVLPDPRFAAFVGTRPAVPGKVPEPILVAIDMRSGAQSTSTLWN
ncbi:MAG: hypothetical protein IPM02_18380 [Betaproteobacteria bacterium]|nr:hypothetical protein [Betaproteobacteria bacterium]